MDFKMEFNMETVKVLDLIFEHLPISMVLTDETGKIIIMNDHYLKYLNLKKEDVIGRPVEDVIPNTRLPIVLNTGLPEISEPHVYSDGVKGVVHRFPLYNDRNEISGCLGMVILDDIHDLDKLIEVNRFLDKKLTKYQNEVRSIYRAKYSFDQILGKSPVIQKLKCYAKRLARNDADILITGESGTGKELWAHAIHNESPRADYPFITVNCGAIPENLLESELFGYEEGAFTGAKKGGKMGKFQLAEGGTLFLDEIGDMPLLMQVKILRALQEREVERIGANGPEKVNVRIIAATNRDLEKMVREGTFREDLFYRLNVLTLQLPPLRQHPEDIPLLVQNFLTQYCNRTGEYKKIASEVIDIFYSYSWPGNIRELKALIERILVCSDMEVITKDDLPLNICLGIRECKYNEDPHSTLNKALEETERELIKKALEMAHESKSEAARILGISRTRLYRKLKQFGLEDA